MRGMGPRMAVTCADAYDEGNVFARILRGELPASKVWESEHALAFHDIRPLAPTHVLVIPKRAAVGLPDFTRDATDAEVAGFLRAVGTVARELGLEGPGYRVLINAGTFGGQEVPHLHAHIFSGRPLGPMLPEA